MKEKVRWEQEKLTRFIVINEARNCCNGIDRLKYG